MPLPRMRHESGVRATSTKNAVLYVTSVAAHQLRPRRPVSSSAPIQGTECRSVTCEAPLVECRVSCKSSRLRVGVRHRGT
jgi:hypothetical protein